MPKRAQPVANHRTFGLVGHRSSGKTSIAEMLMHAAGVVRRPGRVEDGTALLDQEALEKSRRLGLVPAFAWLPWKDWTVQLIDNPGTSHVRWVRALAVQAADLSLVVVSAPDGIERGAEMILRRARHADRSLAVVLSKLDRTQEFDTVVQEVARLTGARVVPLQLPWVENGQLVGLIDVMGMRALRYDEGPTATVCDMPDALAGPSRRAREMVLEAATLADDGLLESYLDKLDLSEMDVWRGLQKSAARGKVVPLLLTAALRGVGGDMLLDAVGRLAPDPAAWVMPPSIGERPRFVAQWVATRLDENNEPVTYFRVWRGPVPANAIWTNCRTGETVRLRKLYRVRGHRRATSQHAAAGALVAHWGEVPGVPGDSFTDGARLPLKARACPEAMSWLWVKTKRSEDHGRLLEALRLLGLVDPSLRYNEEARAGGVRLHAITRGQLDLAVIRLRERFGLHIDVDLPLVKYLERPVAQVSNVHGLHCKMSGEMVSEFGECWLNLEPTRPELGFQYFGEVDEDVLPTRFLAPIGEGARRALARGPTGGYPVTGVLVRCTSGEYDVLESTEAHFELAGERAMSAGLLAAGTELLEPWSELRVFCANDDVGLVLADIASHRGRVVGLEVRDDETTLQVQVPDRELRTQGKRLEGLTGGRAWFVSKPSHYERLPSDFVQEAVAASAEARQRLAGSSAP